MRMTRHTQVRRTLAVLAGGSVVAALGWLPVSPAAALVRPRSQEYAASGSFHCGLRLHRHVRLR